MSMTVYYDIRSIEKGKTMQIPTPGEKLAEYDARLSRIEGIVEQMNVRLTGLESGIRWVIGIQITTLLSLGTLILFKLG